MFDDQLGRIFTAGSKQHIGFSQMRFKADYYPGTPAEQMVRDPRGATTDFMEGKYDESRYLSFWDTTDRVLMIEQSMTDLAIKWDHLYSLFGLNKGFGTSIYEPLV
jgi:hypothetical protein